MNILFVCTDNYTRSVIAELCTKHYLKQNKITTVKASSCGIRANSDISRYSNIHFQILNELGIDTTDFKRTQFAETSFNEFDFIVGMSELHKDYIEQQYERSILLFNEVLNGRQTPVNIGSPDEIDFFEQMKQLVIYINSAIPEILKSLERIKRSMQ